MGCRYTYKGKTYEAHEFDDVLRAMPPAEAAKFMPGVESVPNAPFVGKTEAWVALAMKRMIRYAVDNGFDAVAWTTGEQQADRYDLSKQVDRIDYKKRLDGLYQIGVAKNGEYFSDQAYGAEQLSDVIGKEMAKKVVDSANRKEQSFTGLDLKVGGEGMTAFYDKIVPNVANDLLKKLGGGRVNSVPITLKGIREYDGKYKASNLGDTKLSQPGFPITPEMREAAGQGMPLFSLGDVPGFPSLTKEKIQDHLAARMHSTKTFNHWHTKVGTQYHKAEIDADFRPVFKATQRFVNDVSQFAINAADFAPTLLPKMENVRAVFKDAFGRGAKPKDVAAAAKFTFEATLANERPTVASTAGLTPAQSKLVMEARGAIDQSLDDLAASIGASMVRKLPGGFDPKAIAEAKANPESARAILLKGVDDIAAAMGRDQNGDPADLESTVKSIDDTFDRVEKLKAQGYAPLMRFGRFTVMAKAADGSTAFFSMHESEADAKKQARLLAQDPELAGTAISAGVMSQERFKLFQGISPDTLALFAEEIGQSNDPVFQEYLKLAIANRSALKRLIHRKGTEGYDKDLQRVLAQFITSNARMTSRNYHYGEMLDAAAAIPEAKGDVIDEATKLVQYVQNPVEEAQALRGFLFINFLGGSIASALVNATQPVTMTLPYLSQFAGAASATSKLAAGMQIALGATKATGALHTAMARAAKDGITEPAEVHQLQADASQNFGRNIWWRRGIKVWGSLFSLAESFNRKATFAAAFDIANAPGGLAKVNAAQIKAEKPTFKTAYDFAEHAVQETQGVYNRGNRPNWARGAVGATLFTFKQFSISYIEFLKRLPPKERMLALGILFIAAGAQGLPFAEDIEDIIDAVGQTLGYNTNTKRALRKAAVAALGDTFGNVLTSGMSTLTPFDIGARIGAGNLIPGTGAFKPSTADKVRDVVDFAGPAGSLAKSTFEAAGQLLSGDVKDAARTVAPVAVANAWKGLEMWQTGQYKDKRGKRVVDVDAADALLKGVGLQPSKVAAAQRKASGVQQDISMVKQVEAEIAQKWAEGRAENDSAKVDAARAKLRDWNAKNPGSRIAIDQNQIQRRVKELKSERADRLIKSAPREIRDSIREELR